MRQLIAIALIVTLCGMLVPVPVSAAVLQVTERKLSGLGNGAWSWMQSVIGMFNRGANQGNREQKGVRPAPAPTKEELEARVAALEVNPANEVTIQSRQPLIFTAIPLDQEGNTIHGLRPVWRSSDKQVIFIKHNGEAVAGKPGQATVMARIGSKVTGVRVAVVEGAKEPFGGKKKVDSTRTPQATVRGSDRLVAQKVNAKQKRAHAVSKLTNRTGVMPFIRDPNDDPLPDNETSSLYQPNNLIGTPPGKKKPGALTAASAVPVTESGNKNFSFSLPVVNLPGRGVDASLSLIYNSLLWNKSTNPNDSSTWMTNDVDSGYPAQGFRLGFGQIEDQGSAGFTLNDADGTRHALVYSSQYNYDTTDGTFIHFTGGSGWGTLLYPDGTMVDMVRRAEATAAIPPAFPTATATTFSLVM